MAYGILTGVCMLIDSIEFLIQFIRFGYKGSEHSTLAMLAITLLLLGIDMFYVLWAFSAKRKFSGDSLQSVNKALFGFVDNINKEIRDLSRNNGVVNSVR